MHFIFVLNILSIVVIQGNDVPVGVTSFKELCTKTIEGVYFFTVLLFKLHTFLTRADM